jgi:hypothetical protein
MPGPLLGEERAQLGIECRRLFRVDDMCAVEQRNPSGWDSRTHIVGIGRRCHRVVMSGNDEGGRGDGFYLGAQIGVANGGTARGISDGWRLRQHATVDRNHIRVSLPEFVREPSTHRRVCQRLHARCVHLCDSLIPHRRGADSRRRTGKHDRLNAPRRVNSEPHRGQAAKRQSADVRVIDSDRIEHRDGVDPQRVN